MTKTKRIGIRMDHASAHLMEFTADTIITVELESAFTHQAKEGSLEKGEHLMHNKEQQEQLAYYRKIETVLKEYQDILLFGPTDAKLELCNLLKKDQHFNDIKVVVKPAGKLTEPQEHAFVRDYFFREDQRCLKELR